MVRGTKRKHTFRAQPRHEAASLLQQQQSTAAECTAEWCTTEERTQTKTSCSRFKQSSWLHRGRVGMRVRRTHIPPNTHPDLFEGCEQCCLAKHSPGFSCSAAALALACSSGSTGPDARDRSLLQPAAAPYSFSAFEVRQLAGAGWVVRRGGARSRNAGRAEAHRPVALSVASTGPAQGAAVSLLTRFVAAAGYDQSHSVSAPVGQPTAPARI